MNRRLLVLVTIAAPALGAPPALADVTIRAVPPNRYVDTAPQMAQGERLTFSNYDTAAHDVTSSQNGPDGRPLFASALITGGQSAFVEGSQYLTAGSYPFLCSVHPFMTGTLTVTSAGTPVPRPGGGGSTADTVAPAVALRVTSARLRRFVTRVTVDEASTVAVKATARVGGRRVTVGRGSATQSAAGPRSVRLAVTSAGRRALRSRKSVAVSVRATAKDAAGNARSATASGRLRR